MECRTLELTILSADDIKKVSYFSKMQVYVVVSVVDSSYTSPPQKQTTPVDVTVNKNPRWNFTMKFTLNDAALQSNRLTLNFEIFARRTLLPDNLVGKVHVPASDLVSSVGKADVSHVSYQVRKRSGNPKGVLNFSYKFGEKLISSVPAPAAKPATAGVGPSMAYPYPPPPQHAGAGYAAPYAYPVQQPAYGYPGQMNGYGYGYGQSQQPLQGRRNNNFGMGLGTGLLGGALAGLVVGDLVSDMGNDGGYYDGGFDGGFDDGGFGGF